MRTPRDAPPRDDLTWLRRRTLRTEEPPAPALATVPEPVRSVPSVPSAPVVPPPPAPGHASTSLDLSSPSVPQSPVEPVSGGSPEQPQTSLDLSSPVQTPRPGPVAPRPTPGPAPAQSAHEASGHGEGPRTTVSPALQPRRTTRSAPTLLTPQQPTVTLTRVQSGVGGLQITAATSVGDGDLRLGCAYRLTSGASSLVQTVSGVTVAPPRSRRPVIRATRDRFERLDVDLRQVDALDRMIVYLFSHYDAVRTDPPGTKAMVPWSGVLSTETLAGTRIDVPLRRDPAPGVLVALSLYNVGGELVLRAENALLSGSVRDAVQAFGFDAITWIGPTTPLV
jgi:hypothetical protein